MNTTYVDPLEAEEQWLLDFTLRGSALYEALAARFSFDELMDAADRLGIPSAEAVEHIRILQREFIVRFDGRRFEKAGGPLR